MSRTMPMTKLGGVAIRTPFWVLTGGLAVIFLYPLVWTTISSFSPQAGSAQTDGWGFGNYV
jgi:multiple sugar transport system permease protein